MNKDEYLTLEGLSQGIYREKGSRFISLAMPVNSVEEIRQALEKYRKEYHDARHHCYAYRIGDEPYEFRYQDDGEPSGTAGKPIYGQILSFGLTQVLIIVIRYFGGIKLGTGGLIHAYKTAARDAVSQGKVISKTWTSRLELRFDYLIMNEVMRIIKEQDIKIIRQDSNEQVHIILETSKRETEQIKNRFYGLGIPDVAVI